MLLLERDQQLSTLARWHDATLTGGGSVVFVTGEAGIGKTARRASSSAGAGIP